MNKHSITGLLACAALLAACGGLGASDEAPPAPPPVTQVPNSAMASNQTMIDYIKTMAADDAGESLSMSPQGSPTSDTDEPVPGG